MTKQEAEKIVADFESNRPDKTPDDMAAFFQARGFLEGQNAREKQIEQTPEKEG